MISRLFFLELTETSGVGALKLGYVIQNISKLKLVGMVCKIQKIMLCYMPFVIQNT